MIAIRKKQKRSTGIIVLKRQVWISELTGILFVAVLLTVLTAIVSLLIINESKIRANNISLNDLHHERIILKHRLAMLREKENIRAAVNAFVNGKLHAKTVRTLTNLVYQNSKRYGYDPFLVLAVIHVESVFDPAAIGRFRDGAVSGAMGLMQLKFKTAKEVADDLEMPLEEPEALFVPEINIALGVAYLTRLIAQFKDIRLGILAYNLGPGFVRQSLAKKQPLPRRYYYKVLRSYYRFVAMQGVMTPGLPGK
jgi:soluble lytic murein transglycosylase-like protein